jgi:hypothetical protein
MSVEFELTMDVQYTDRTAYDFLNWMGDIGGVLEILLLACNAIAFPFSIIRIKTLISNRVFHLSAATQQSLFGQVDLSEKQLNDHNLNKSKTGEIFIGIPSYLTLGYIKHLCCCLRHKKSNFAKYKQII